MFEGRLRRRGSRSLIPIFTTATAAKADAPVAGVAGEMAGGVRGD